MGEWIINAAVGLMLGVLLGIVIGLKHIIMLDRKIELLLEKLHRIDVKTEHEVASIIKRKQTKRKTKKKKK